MALIIGSANADTGMSQAIYQEIDRQLSPPMQTQVDSAQDAAKIEAQKVLDSARQAWKQLAFAIAQGVISHMLSNMEIVGVVAEGNLSVVVQGDTGPADPNQHRHNVNLTDGANKVVFNQSNGGIGLVK